MGEAQRKEQTGEAMSTGGEVRKPWRAWKTMAVSSRSQMEALKKAKRGGEGALVAVAPQGPEAKPLLDTKTLQILLSHWYKDEVQHLLCLSLEVQLEVPPTAGEAPVFERVTDVEDAALCETVQEIHQRKKRLRLEADKEAFPKPSRSSSAGAGVERSDTKESGVKKNLFVIELTKESNKLHEDEEAKRRGNSTEEIRMLNPLQPLLDASNQGPGDLPHLPKAHLHPSPVERFQGTLSPQKLVPAVACLERPKGITLQWGVLDPDPCCAPVKSFHLFLCQEEDGRKGILFAWRETHCIHAISLSIACSLDDFPPNTWCYFAIRAKDVYGREGPFSEVRPIFNA